MTGGQDKIDRALKSFDNATAHLGVRFQRVFNNNATTGHVQKKNNFYRMRLRNVDREVEPFFSAFLVILSCFMSVLMFGAGSFFGGILFLLPLMVSAFIYWGDTRRVAGLTKEHADAEAARKAEQQAIEGREANQRKAQQEADRKEWLKSEREASERSVDISIQQYKAKLEQREKNNKAPNRYLEEQLRDNAKESEDKRTKRTLFGFFWS